MLNTIDLGSAPLPRIARSFTQDVRAALRLSRTAWHIVRGLFIVTVLFPRLNEVQRQQHIGRWSRRVLRALGVTLHAQGHLGPGAKMLVANHVSWLDVMVLHALCPQARFVAKSEVRHWPLIGRLVAGARTFFVERQRPHQTRQTVAGITAALRTGATVVVFPEGTTSNGSSVLPFRPSLLQAALAGGTVVRPVALRYVDSHRRLSRDAPYVDNDTLLGSLWRTARAQQLVADVRLLPALAAPDADRRVLAVALRHAVQAALHGTATRL
ncbi:MAG TPA: lysophospholipid acyltransferase family protein [Burkholderiaceae bacterium]|nr:lysophospholipid acyltransferase family protein [Burkholderiaceae bacterium]